MLWPGVTSVTKQQTSPALQQRSTDKSYTLGQLNVPGAPFLHFSLINTYEAQTRATQLRAEHIKINMTWPLKELLVLQGR